MFNLIINIYKYLNIKKNLLYIENHKIYSNQKY